MNIRLLRFILLLTPLIICILPYKTNADESITINPEACQTALLSHEGTLSIFYKAIREDDTDKLLTLKNLNWNLYTDYQKGQILLHYASLLGKTEAIYTLISEVGVDVNIQDPKIGWTALHYAILNKDPSSRVYTIHTLIKLGAGINILDNSDHEPSWYAEDMEKLRFTYSMEQKIKIAELTVSPYDTPISHLANLLQIKYSTVYLWVQKYREKHNIPTSKQNIYSQSLRTIAVNMVTKDKMTRAQVAKELDIPKGTISNWIDKHNKENDIQTRKVHPQEQRSKVIKMSFERGMTEEEIAKKLDIPKNTVRSLIYRYKRKYNQKLKKVISMIIENNMSKTQIAKALGIPKDILSDWIRRNRRKIKAIKMSVRDGMTGKQIAESLGVYEGTVYTWVHRYKKEHNMLTQQIYPQEIKDQAIDMFKSGMKAIEISKELDIPQGEVYYWIRKHKKENGLEIEKKRTLFS